MSLRERFEHVRMDEAARLLGISRRTLSAILGRHPEHCAFAGRAKVFYAEHLARLRQAIDERTKARCSTSSGGPTPPTGTLSSRCPDVLGYEEALARLTKPARGASPGRSTRRSGNVVPMAKPRV
jgi:hypothetical protein